MENDLAEWRKQIPSQQREKTKSKAIDTADPSKLLNPWPSALGTSGSRREDGFTSALIQTVLRRDLTPSSTLPSPAHSYPLSWQDTERFFSLEEGKTSV